MGAIMLEFIRKFFTETLIEHLSEFVFLLVAGISIFIIDKIRNKVISRFAKLNSLHPLERSVIVGYQINNLLAELRIKTGADRSSLTQFHNGDVFSDSSPMWKCSRTLEICGPGISSEIKNNQNILASLKTAVLVPLFHSDITNNGTKTFKIDQSTVVVYDINNMDSSYWKSQEQFIGCRMCIRCSMKDLNTSNVVGYCSLDYNEKISEEEIKLAIDILPIHTSQISYLLTSTEKIGFWSSLFKKE